MGWHWFIKGNAARFAVFPSYTGHLTFPPRISAGFPQRISTWFPRVFSQDFQKYFHKISPRISTWFPNVFSQDFTVILHAALLSYTGHLTFLPRVSPKDFYKKFECDLGIISWLPKFSRISTILRGLLNVPSASTNIGKLWFFVVVSTHCKPRIGEEAKGFLWEQQKRCSCKFSCAPMAFATNIFSTRSLRAIQALTSSWRQFRPVDFVLCALWALRRCDPCNGDWKVC